MEKKITPWYEAYFLIAQILKAYHLQYPNEAGKVIFKILIEDEEFKILNTWAKAFDEEWAKESVDPIQLFASISGSRSRDETRRNRINRLLRLLSQDDAAIKKFDEASQNIDALKSSSASALQQVQYSEIDFLGCPSPPPVRLQAVREYQNQEKIWSIFSKVFASGSDKLSESDWISVQRWYGVGYPSFTVFLFWIRSDLFLPLDNNNRAFLKKFNRLPTNEFKLEIYKNLLREIRVIDTPIGESLFREITLVAKQDAEGRIEQKNYSKFLNVFLGIKEEESPKNLKTPLPSGTFLLVALETFQKRSLGDIGDPHLKPLAGNSIFPLDQAFKFPESRPEDQVLEVKYEPNRTLSFFYTGKENQLADARFNVEVQAIVGKNGAGKSTIVELILKVLHEVSTFVSEGHLFQGFSSLPELDFALYCHDEDGLKQIRIRNSQVTIGNFGFLEESSVFSLQPGEKRQLVWEDINNFFYSIIVNYSLYAFKETEKGEDSWLHSLFHKNDGYQTPVVITPMRKEANIDMREENKFAITRLLGILFFSEENALDQVNPQKVNGRDQELNSIRIMTDDKSARRVDYGFIEGQEWVPKEYEKDAIWVQIYMSLKENNQEKEKILAAISESFRGEIDWFSDWKNLTYDDGVITASYYNSNILFAATEYLIRKIIKMADVYSQVFPGHIYEDPESKQKRFRLKITQNSGDSISIAEKIFNNRSHITTKFRQTINYLRFEVWKQNVNNVESFFLDIEDGARHLNQISITELSQTHRKESYTPEELLPPPIFNANIKLRKLLPKEVDGKIFEKDWIDFHSLSSGEKHRIYIIGTILYHLRNLDSVGKKATDSRILEESEATSKMFSYRNINLILDEIELYYHPDYQRTFLAYLLDRLGRVWLQNIQSINILFVTHSPYILSDIPHYQVLKLQEGKPDRKELKTLAANIHDLLKENFFMDKGVMGEYAQERIRELINYLEDCIAIQISNKNRPKPLPLPSHEKWDRHKSKKIIELIGEPLLRNEMVRMHDQAFADSFRLEEARKRRAALQREIEDMEKKQKIQEAKK